MSLKRLVGVFAVLLTLLARIAYGQPQQVSIPVLVLCNGDDGYTSRLCESIEFALDRPLLFLLEA